MQGLPLQQTADGLPDLLTFGRELSPRAPQHRSIKQLHAALLRCDPSAPLLARVSGLESLFAWLASLSKNLHNFIAPLFMVSVVAMIVLYIRHNLPKSYDFQFLANAWNVMARGKHVPSGKFNAGEKVWFWGGVVVLSVAVSWTGLILLFPNFDQTRAAMQEAWIWHATAALLYIAISFGHMYLGTIGLEGSYQAMRTGWVDESWAKEHHQIWYEEVKSGRRDAPGGAIPAGAPHMKEKA